MSNPGSIIPTIMFSAVYLLTIYGFFKTFRHQELVFYKMLRIFSVIMAFIFIFGFNLLTQWISCNATDFGMAAFGTVPVVIGVMIALAISAIKICRVPIASLFRNSIKTSNKCCKEDISIDTIEKANSNVELYAYLFYIGFAMLYGMTIGNGISINC